MPHMYDLKKMMNEILTRLFDAEQLDSIAKDLDPTFDMHEITGFIKSIPIPRQVAAETLLRHFRQESQFVELIGLIISNNGSYLYGTKVKIPFIDRLLKLLEGKKWIYDPRLGRFKRDQSAAQSADWGFMQEGEEYHLSFVSIDIVSNSELVLSNVKVDIENTYSKLRSYIAKHVEANDGRIWYWHGDGGLAVFHDYVGVRNSMISMISILSYLPVFNLCENELRPQDDIKLRIGINYGKAEYKNDTSKIVSEDLKLAEDLEKNFTSPNSITTSGVVYQFLPHEIRKNLEVIGEREDLKIYKYQVL